MGSTRLTVLIWHTQHHWTGIQTQDFWVRSLCFIHAPRALPMPFRTVALPTRQAVSLLVIACFEFPLYVTLTLLWNSYWLHSISFYKIVSYRRSKRILFILFLKAYTFIWVPLQKAGRASRFSPTPAGGGPASSWLLQNPLAPLQMEVHPSRECG